MKLHITITALNVLIFEYAVHTIPVLCILFSGVFLKIKRTDITVCVSEYLILSRR